VVFNCLVADRKLFEFRQYSGTVLF
jgi:hypothetical protein